MNVPLSILDLSPISAGSDAATALRNSIDLAQHAERWGYRRYFAAGSKMDTNKTDTNTPRSRESGHDMRGRPLQRSRCDDHILVLCIAPCSR